MIDRQSDATGDWNRERLIELYERLQTENVDAACQAELEELLGQADARREYVRMVQQEVLLENLPPEWEQRAAPVAQSIPSARAVGDGWARSAWALTATLLAGLVVALLMWPDRQNVPAIVDVPTPVEVQLMPAPEPKVVLSQEAGAEFFAERTPRVGSELSWRREYQLIHGHIELAFPNGAMVILDSPSAFEIESETALSVVSGRCSVYAPEGAQGFEVHTPAANVVDLGTRFSVEISETGESRVQVVEGQAQVFPRADDDSESMILDVGAAREYSQVAGAASQVPYRPEVLTRSLPDRIISYEAVGPTPDRVDQLKSVRVQRGGEEFDYTFGELIGADVASFRERVGAEIGNVLLPREISLPQTSAFLHDDLFSTGVINPGGDGKPLAQDPKVSAEPGEEHTLAPGMTFQFHRPVVNDDGPDLVLFEIQTHINVSLAGDGFFVSPTHFRAGLKSHHVTRFDIAMLSESALKLVEFQLLEFGPEPVGALEELAKSPTTRSFPTSRFHVLAVGIDLSDLGVRPGESVSALFLQDDDRDTDRVDPVLIGGFPPLKAPLR